MGVLLWLIMGAHMYAKIGERGWRVGIERDRRRKKIYLYA
jgi:hypothetical protein